RIVTGKSGSSVYRFPLASYVNRRTRIAWLSVSGDPPDRADTVDPDDSTSLSAVGRSSMSAPVSAQTWVFGSSMKMFCRFVVGAKSAPHQRPSAYQSFDWAVLVVGERTTVGSTTKSRKGIPARGARE